MEEKENEPLVKKPADPSSAGADGGKTTAKTTDAPEVSKRHNPFNTKPKGSVSPVKLASVREITETEDGEAPAQTPEKELKESQACPLYFGVKSYLHQFYDAVSVKNPALYEDIQQEEEFRYLIRPRKKKCSKTWFRIGLFIGMCLLGLGLIAIILGYAIPRRLIIIGVENNLEIIDKRAINFNTELDLCKLLGLVVFCVGGMIIVVTLMLPTCLSGYCDDGLVIEPFRVSVKEEALIPKSPTEKKIPVTEKIKSVQPVWDDKNMLATKQGLVSFP